MGRLHLTLGLILGVGLAAPLRSAEARPPSSSNVDSAAAEARIALSSVRSAAAELPEGPERDELFARIGALSDRLDSLAAAARASEGERLQALVPRNGALVRVPVDVGPTPPPVRATTPGRGIPSSSIFALLRSLETEAFAEGRRRVLEDAARTRWFTAAQVRRILEALDFSEERVEAGVLLHPRVVDPDSWGTVYGAFDFPSDAQRLRDRLGG
jgi:hypothetical protein